jgi:DNA-directed RNA polymerase specialized sigma24 family protein
MSPQSPNDWPSIFDDLTAWHEHRDNAAANRALSALEPWLRARIPAPVRARWSPDELEDALQSFLERLLAKPLPSTVDSPDAYFRRALRNHCLDMKRGRKNEPHAQWDESRPPQTTTQAPASKQKLARAGEALERLSMKDRVVIKLVDLPWALTLEELSWLGQRCGRSVVDLRSTLEHCFDKLELSLLFDPGPPPETPKERRDRLERFRRRRSRARAKLRAALEVSP